MPTHIWCFVKLEDMPRGGRRIEYGGVYLDDNVYAVVEAAEYDDPEVTTRMTDLFTPLTKEVGKTNRDGEVLERRFYLADVEAIVGPCAVTPDIGGPANAYFQVKPRDEWAQEFIGWIRRPHTDDKMVWSDEEDEDEEDGGQGGC